MSSSSEKIINEALQLPSVLRAHIAERLIESLDFSDSEGLSPEWRDEIAQRCRDIDEGTVELVPAAKVMEEAYARLK